MQRLPPLFVTLWAKLGAAYPTADRPDALDADQAQLAVALSEVLLAMDT